MLRLLISSLVAVASSATIELNLTSSAGGFICTGAYPPQGSSYSKIAAYLRAELPSVNAVAGVMYDVNGSNIGTIWGPALPPNATDFSGMTNEYIGACTRSTTWNGTIYVYDRSDFDKPCKCQQVFMSNTQSQMTCLVSFLTHSTSPPYTSTGIQTTVCTAIHSVTIRP